MVNKSLYFLLSLFCLDLFGNMPIQVSNHLIKNDLFPKEWEGKQTKFDDVNVIPYIQADFLIPGVGIALQMEKFDSQLGLEFDASLSSIFFTTMAKTSGSILLFSKNHNHSLNFGVGPGYFLDIFSGREKAIFVIPIGYSYKGVDNEYWRMGVNLSFNVFRKSPLPIPYLRFGYMY